jgi:16S rRNA (cytosine967-C5)-methyltransferase
MKRRPTPRARPKRPRRPPHGDRLPDRPIDPPATKPGKPRSPGRSAPSATRHARKQTHPSSVPARTVTHVAPIDWLAETTVAIASEVEHAVLERHRRADRTLAVALRARRDLAAPDQRFVSQVVFALFRWKGWIDPLGLRRIEARMLLSTLLDSRAVHPVCRAWARVLGREPDRLIALGDAPSWPARAEGLRRLLGGQPVTADPWKLFPPWLREQLPLPAGDLPAKARYTEFLRALQAPAPLWVRAQGPDESATWSELAAEGVKPWVHRRITRAARLDHDVDVYRLPPFLRGELEIQDLASQAVALVCDPDPGERWWDACAGAGGKALHLAALMNGKGLVVATDHDERPLQETARRARRSPFRNLTTKPWDGHHPVGKAGTFHGVLVDAPCSAIGTWRRNPDARWTLDRAALARLAALQAQLLAAASRGVRPGGTLVYSVCTLTLGETQQVVRNFLAEHTSFRLDPFPHPLTGSSTDGTLLIWPQESDTDAMFLARMIRTG